MKFRVGDGCVCRGRFGIFLGLAICSLAIGQTQMVYLNFNGSSGDINYTTDMRNAIQTQLEEKYAPWDIEFSQSVPAQPYSQLTFNSGFSGGLAQQIDFRNLDPRDTAQVNVDGIFGLNPNSPTQDLITASGTIGAHELGHLLGLRHGDGFGPLGSGMGNPGPGNGSYLPTYPGPSSANEVNDHVMATPAYGANNLLRDTWLSERSAVKVQFAFDGVVLDEGAGTRGDLATAQPIAYSNMTVPNTIRSGQRAGQGDFSVDAMSLLGELNSNSELDYYRFDASAGDLFNFEVMSGALGHRLDSFDPQISVLDASGSLIPYYGSTAFNDDEFETTDSILLDLMIPDDGTYYVRINSWNSSSNGEYELFGYRFNGEAMNTTCDFDGNGICDCADVDALVADIASGSNTSSFDLTGDGVVDTDDLDSWLAQAGASNLPTGDAYLPGDANLDGFVDLSDFNLWNDNKFTQLAAWCSGDFNADGAIDTTDFNIWNVNKFSSSAAFSTPSFPSREKGDFTSDGATILVPEPNAGWLLFVGLLALVMDRRN